MHMGASDTETLTREPKAGQATASNSCGRQEFRFHGKTPDPRSTARLPCAAPPATTPAFGSAPRRRGVNYFTYQPTALARWNTISRLRGNAVGMKFHSGLGRCTPARPHPLRTAPSPRRRDRPAKIARRTDPSGRAGPGRRRAGPFDGSPMRHRFLAASRRAAYVSQPQDV